MDINNSSMYGIGFSVFVIIIAAMNLVVDFDFIEGRKGHQSIWNGMDFFNGYTIWLYLN